MKTNPGNLLVIWFYLQELVYYFALIVFHLANILLSYKL